MKNVEKIVLGSNGNDTCIIIIIIIESVGVAIIYVVIGNKKQVIRSDHSSSWYRQITGDTTKLNNYYRMTAAW